MRAKPPGGLDGTSTTGQAAGRRTVVRLGRPRAVVLAGAVLAALVAVIVAVQLPNSSSGRQLTEAQLRPGDCLIGSNLGLGTSSPWPRLVTAVPCTQQHLAEVLFAGNAWPQSLAAYPGTNTISIQAWNRCLHEFIAYDGIVNDGIVNDVVSSFTYNYIGPTGAGEWRSGDRWLVCVAHDGTTLVNYSIKGSRR